MPTHSTSPPTAQGGSGLSRISELAADLNAGIDRAIRHITDVNEQTRLLSFNAQIEAARAGGQTGAAFAVVASAIQQLSERTSGVAEEMRKQTQGAIEEVGRVSSVMATQTLGTRLCDLALNNIDLIDRNLYERTCDVRWWATDSAIVNALTCDDPKDREYASQRMGVILNAYTVYYDLVLADIHGNVIANGRPRDYLSAGQNVAHAPWFQAAIKSRSGDEYGFQSVHASELVKHQHVLAYSCSVREGGQAHGRTIGVLGVLFKWDDLAQVIVKRTPLPEDEWPRSRVCIVDDEGRVLADSADRLLKDTLDIDRAAAFASKLGWSITQYQGRPTLIGHAHAPGYETYTTGWHSVILQEVASASGNASVRNAA